MIDWEARCADVPSHPTEEVNCGCVDLGQTTGFEDPALDCLFCGMFRCEPTQGGLFHDLGETYVEVFGPDGADCSVQIRGDIEGGNDVYGCSWPLGFEPWPQLAAVDAWQGLPPPAAMHCQLTEQCVDFLDKDTCSQLYECCGLPAFCPGSGN